MVLSKTCSARGRALFKGVSGAFSAPKGKLYNPRLLHSLFLLVAVLVVAPLGMIGQAGSEAIEKAYRQADEAYATIQPELYVASLAPRFSVTDASGRTLTVTRADALTSIKNELRSVPGHRLVRRQVSSIEQIHLDGESAIVTGTRIKELVGVDPAGTIVRVRESVRFQDSWQGQGSAWVVVASRALMPVERTSDAQLSPRILEMLKQMRVSSDQLRDFNNANNMSACMNSDANQKYEYQTRKAYCSP